MQARSRSATKRFTRSCRSTRTSRPPCHGLQRPWTNRSGTRRPSRPSRSRSRRGGTGRDRRPAAAGCHDVPTGRLAAEGRPRDDGSLARAALTVPRPRSGRARARLARCAEGSRERGESRAPPCVCPPPATGGGHSGKVRFRRATRPLVPLGSARNGTRPARDRPGLVPARDDPGAPRSARVGPGRPWPQAVVPARARALAARARRGAGSRYGVRRRELWLVAAAAIAPRLVVLLHERGQILTAFTDKSDDFAQTFVHHGTFGFIPGEPSAYTQPLYGFFLVPIYWIFGRTWWAVGTIQILVATVTALLVYAIGARALSRRRC